MIEWENHVELVLNIDRPISELGRDIKDIGYGLMDKYFVRLTLLANGVDVGEAELHLGDTLEIRWIEIYDQFQGLGYFKSTINIFRELGMTMTGEIVDLYVIGAWKSVGAEMIDEWSFMIR